MAKDLVLIDSSVWIEGLRPTASDGLRNAIKSLVESDRAAIMEMIRLELLAGARGLSEFESLRADLEALECLETTPEVWRAAENLSLVLTRAGKRVASADLLIAASARFYKLSLWHADEDFERIGKSVSDLKTFRYPKQTPPL